MVAPIEGTPGEREGFQPEDIILEVDNKEVNNTKQVVDLIRGPAGSKVEIKFWRKGFAEPKTVVVVREKIIVQSVKSRELSVAGQKIKVIKVNTFGEKTYRQFKDAFTEAKTKGTKLVALDFRNNPGGLLNEALKMLALFMRESDTALTYRTRNETVPYDAAYLRSQKELGIRSFGEFRDFKIVLLVNKGSASASEIFAGTMKDWGYTVIGEQSFGKGVGQSCTPLSDSSVFCLTTFEFLVGNNRVSIRDKGVVPTVAVKNSDNKAEDKALDKAVEILLGQ